MIICFFRERGIICKSAYLMDMRRLLPFWITLLSFLFTQWLSATPQRVMATEIDLVANQSTVALANTLEVGIRMKLDAGWHTYAENTTTGFPMTVKWTLPEGATVSTTVWPEPKTYTTPEYTDYIYDETVIFPYRIQLPETLTPRTDFTVKVKVSWLMCAESCVPGEAVLESTFPIEKAPIVAPEQSAILKTAWQQIPGAKEIEVTEPIEAVQQSLLMLLGLGFVGGLILNLMPCVFPVIGIKILGFVNQAGQSTRKVALHGLSFSGGVILSFWTLAATLLLLRAGGAQLGWGFQLQNPSFIFLLMLFLFLFGLNLSGVFEVGQRLMGLGGGLTQKDGLTGSFFSGVLATLVATPCSAPFLATALGAALTLSPAASLSIFTSIALGLSAPYLLLSIFPKAVRYLPRPGAWMETFKQAMAFPLYATVAFMFWVLTTQISDENTYGSYAILMSGLALTLVGMGAWIFGRWAQPHLSQKSQWAARIAALGLIGAAILTGLPNKRSADSTEIVWEKWSPETVAQYVAANKMIYVDFTAKWCATCQTNKWALFHGPGSEQIIEKFKTLDVKTLRADWTNRDPEITAALAQYDRSAVPFNLLYRAGNPEPVVLPVILTPQVLLPFLP
jgi:thiol:disulfide interchange protein